MGFVTHKCILQWPFGHNGMVFSDETARSWRMAQHSENSLAGSCTLRSSIVSAGRTVPLDHRVDAVGGDAAGAFADFHKLKLPIFDQTVYGGTGYAQLGFGHVDAVQDDTADRDDVVHDAGLTVVFLR